MTWNTEYKPINWGKALLYALITLAIVSLVLGALGWFLDINELFKPLPLTIILLYSLIQGYNLAYLSRKGTLYIQVENEKEQQEIFELLLRTIRERKFDEVSQTPTEVVLKPKLAYRHMWGAFKDRSEICLQKQPKSLVLQAARPLLQWVRYKLRHINAAAQVS
jgi:hypothetical protein